MANLRDVRLRMRAIEQTLQVTKAMNLISTSKLRKGRRILEDTEPYFTRIGLSMFDILSAGARVHSNFLSRPDTGDRYRSAIVAITTDKGLAGGYNANIYRTVLNLCATVRNPILVLVGSIGYHYFIHTSQVILENFSFRSRIPTVENAREIADYLIAQYIGGMFNEVHIVYTHMYSALKLLPTERQLLPLKIEKLQEQISATGGKKREKLQFEFLPSAEEVFDALVPMYIKGEIYGALIEAYTAEQSARMAAMDEASKNAEEMLGNLTVYYNRVRQANITQEMTEIVGGAAALT
ncbi:ATP synthase gamma chain [Spirochaetia bacterium]|nr:ATP synthase gamma chain [Spirochaetia bacterium]